MEWFRIGAVFFIAIMIIAIIKDAIILNKVYHKPLEFKFYMHKFSFRLVVLVLFMAFCFVVNSLSMIPS